MFALRRDGWDAAVPGSTSSGPASTSSGPASTNSSGDLSTAAVVGIGVSASVLVFAAFIGLLGYFRRRRHNRQQSAPLEDVAAEVDSGYPYSRAEKDGRERFELSSKGKPAEAEGQGIAELDSGWQAAEVEGSGPHDRRSVVR